MSPSPSFEIPVSDILGWDVSTWSPALAHWSAAIATQDRPLECLEIGAGPGGPSLWLASLGNNVVCSNVSNSAELARPLHSRYPAIEGIEYSDVDALHIPWVGRFDVIVLRSVLGGIHPADLPTLKLVIAEILVALKPGGRLLFAENVRGTVLHRLARAAAVGRRSGSLRYPSVAELRSILNGFSSSEIKTTGVLALFGIRESHRTALARADVALFNRLVPSTWRYVAYGSATK
ncbi:MAG: class I SAM-dependent methyltransferase [Rhodoglobus sp.]